MRAEGLGARLAATVRVLAALPRDRRTPFLSAPKVGAIRDARLRAVVQHAGEAVPYYRDLFRQRGIDAREIRTVDDLRELPLLDKETVQRDPDRFRAAVPGAVPFPTSGSSGTPLTVWHDPGALLRYLTSGQRDRVVVARLLGTRRYRTMSIGYAESTGQRARAFRREATLLPARSHRPRLSPTAPVEDVARAVDAARPDVLSGYGHYLEWILRLVVAGAIEMHPPKLVRYHASAMSEDCRRMVERDLGVSVMSTYGAVETFAIGFECEERSGFHLHDDLCHVRVVGEDGTDARGELGEVVVSNLVNRAMVLLNYRLGDVAALASAPCPCGRTFPVLTDLQGRVSEIVHLSSGRAVNPQTLSDKLLVSGLLRFQLVQEARDRFRLAVVTDGDASFDRVVRTAVPELRSLLEGASVEVVRRDTIDGNGQRKVRRVVALPPEPELRA